jgi:CRP-like cAMP-binding protein
MKLEDTVLFQQTNIDVSTLQIKQYPSNYTIEIEGDFSSYLGIILEGKIFVKSYSLAGKDFTISTLEPGMVFGDVLLFGSKSNVYPGNLITYGQTSVAILRNSQAKEYIETNTQFVQNYLRLLSDKVYNINFKSKLLSQDSLRDKILFYLHQQSKIQNSNTIQLNMSKEQLANILFIQRPSLSRELIKMKEEGLIDYNRWTITLKEKDE